MDPQESTWVLLINQVYKAFLTTVQSGGGRGSGFKKISCKISNQIESVRTMTMIENCLIFFLLGREIYQQDNYL